MVSAIRFIYFDVNRVLSQDAIELETAQLVEQYQHTVIPTAGEPPVINPTTLNERRDLFRPDADYGYTSDYDYWIATLSSAGADLTRKPFVYDLTAAAQPIPGTIAVYRALHDAGFPVGVLSDDSREMADIKAARLGYGELASAYIISGYEFAKKPHAAIFEHALAAARRVVDNDVQPAEVLFIDDNPDNCIGAEAAGFSTILFLRTPLNPPPPMDPDYSTKELLRELAALGITIRVPLRE